MNGLGEIALSTGWDLEVDDADAVPSVPPSPRRHQRRASGSRDAIARWVGEAFAGGKFGG